MIILFSEYVWANFVCIRLSELLASFTIRLSELLFYSKVHRVFEFLDKLHRCTKIRSSAYKKRKGKASKIERNSTDIWQRGNILTSTINVSLIIVQQNSGEL